MNFNASHLASATTAPVLIVINPNLLTPHQRIDLTKFLMDLPQPAAKTVIEDKVEPKSGKSFPLTIGQAKALIEAVDDRTVDVLRAIAEAYDPATGKGELNWLAIRKIVYGNVQAANEYHRFTKGRVGGVHRSLRYITKDYGAKLLISTGKSYCIDGEAILILRKAFNIV